MNVRKATEADATRIYDIARQSIQASYAVSPTAIDGIMEAWFDVGAVEDRLDESERVSGREERSSSSSRTQSDDNRPAAGDSVIGVAETDDAIVGFAEGTITDDAGELVWLHVHPEERGQKAGTELFEWMRETLLDQGVGDVHARILASNSEGDGFVERFGYERVDQQDTEFGGENWREHIYAPTSGDTGETDPAEPRDVPSTIEKEGDELFVENETIPGDGAPFHPLYHDDNYDEQYGYYCLNCGSTVEAADELDRIKCTDCGNVHRPDDWDGAYL